MMKNPKNPYYLDSNFLIQIYAPKHKFHKISVNLMANLLIQNEKMFISCLAIDETLFHLYKTWQDQVPEEKRKPFKSYYFNFKNIIDGFLNHPLIEIIQFENNLIQGLKNVLESIRDYNLRPRDAFHYAIMQDCKTNQIVTKNRKHFKRLPGINVISPK